MSDTIELTALSDVPAGLFIDGVWLSTGDRLTVIDPSTGAACAEVSAGGAADGIAALDAADRAAASWRDWTPRARADLFHHAHALLSDRAERFAQVMTAESGKPLTESRAEVALSLGFFRWFAEQIAHLHGSYQPGSAAGYRIIETSQPVGPSLLITPWNFPLLMSARKAGAALAAGCTVVMKSAQETPLTAALFVATLAEAGFPPGVINLIHTRRSGELSAALMADARLRKVSFTGSTAVGTTLMTQAAPGIVNPSFELGGNGPFVVLDDADLDLAVAQAIVCKFRNAGQACVAANRIIVQRAVAAEFAERFVAATRALTVGPGAREGTEVGPVISAAQRERVTELVARFSAAGGRVLTGGEELPGDGFFFTPTVIQADAVPVELLEEELFAPIATLLTVDTVAEALAAANRTHYGLAGYVFTQDISRAIAFAERMDTGMVGVNRGIMADPAAPFGGVKSSGLGREGGHDGIREFLEPKYIALTVDDTKAVH